MSKQQEIQSQLLQLLLRYGTITRPQCIQELGVRPGTLLEAINALKTRGLVQEPSRHSRRTGRKAPELELVPDCLWCAGLEVRADGIQGVVVDATGVVQESCFVPCDFHQNSSDYLQKLFLAVETLVSRCGERWGRVSGLGFADPGLVDIRRGVSLRAVNLPGWRDIQTKAELEKRFGMPVGLWPESAVCTHLEYLQRARELATGSLFYLRMGVGIGGGFIRQGELFFGDQDLGMEVGHLIVKPEGPPCQCGNRGCLEAIAGFRGIHRRVREALESGVGTALPATNFSIAKFAECARTDKTALLIASEVCESIGTALATVVTLLNPSCIVLHGELTGLGDLMLETIRRVLNANCFPAAVQNLQLELSTLKATDTARGAALLMRNQLIHA
ncbi:MAG: ROK family protein [Victivallales bacterium]|nr:ROK family protein [Victivallales bacterium]